jgi:hypothetical protein
MVEVLVVEGQLFFQAGMHAISSVIFWYNGCPDWASILE